jgi:hypothetical protein
MMEPSTRAGRESLTATRFGVAMAMSLVLHAVALWELPTMQRLRPGPVDPEGITLSVQLAPPPGPPPQAALERRQLPRALAPPAPRSAPERSAPRPAAPPAAETPAVSAAARRPAEPDLMAYVEARRRGRNAPAEDAASPPRAQLSENERASRAAAANLASSSTMVFGYDPSRSGGVFQIDRLSSDYAEISFSGWHAGARRHMKQLIEVRRGAHADIRIHLGLATPGPQPHAVLAAAGQCRARGFHDAGILQRPEADLRRGPVKQETDSTWCTARWPGPG